ncbi:hypothetical protein ACP4OV_017424 [Aristida adscensionis]
MARSKVAVVPLLLLLVVVLSGSSTWIPAAAAARPLAGGAVVGKVIVLPSVGQLLHKLPPLEMKQAGASPSCQTWDPNNINCPPKAPKRP